ncbi:hypothetical protein TSUD_74480 [Trifolium subterraneum]|nr:hypothetical protein TSUD_74480 [Trifolium subterraneum]
MKQLNGIENIKNMLNEVLESKGINVNEEEREAHKRASQSSMQQREHVDERGLEYNESHTLR